MVYLTITVNIKGSKSISLVLILNSDGQDEIVKELKRFGTHRPGLIAVLHHQKDMGDLVSD